MAANKGNRVKIKLRLIGICILTMLCTTSCWDNVELENRAFVTAMAIDKNDSGNFITAMEIPLISSEKSVIMGKDIKITVDRSVSSAIYGADILTDKSLYLGLMKLAVLSEDILDDEKMFRKVIEALAWDKDISRKLIILSSKTDALKAVESETQEEKLIGTYIATYYKKNNPSLVYRQDLDRLSRAFAEDGLAVIPAVSYEEERLIFSGAAVCENYSLKGWLGSDEFKGLLWVYSQAEGAALHWGEGEEYTAIGIDKCKAHMDFYEAEGEIYARINVDVKARINELPVNNKPSALQIKEKAEEAVKAQINTAYEALYNNMGVDGFNLLSEMRKKSPSLYKIYFENMAMDFKNIPVVINMDMAVNSTSLE